MAETEQERRNEPRPEGASSDGDEFETVVRRKRQSNVNSHKKPFWHNDGMSKDYGQGPAHLHNGGGGGRGRGRDREVCDRDRDWRERDRERDFRSNSRNNRNFRRNHFRESNPHQMPNTGRNKSNKMDAQLNTSLTQGGDSDNMNQTVKDVPCSSLKDERSSGENGASSPGAGDKSEESCDSSIVNHDVEQVALASDQKEEKEKQTEIIITPAPPPQVNPWRVNRLVNSSTDQEKDKSNKQGKDFVEDKQGKGCVEDKQKQPEINLTPVPISSPQRGNSRRSKNRAASGQSQHSQPEEKLDKPEEVEVQQVPEVVAEIIITPAPLPQVNPWLVNRNAASVIIKSGEAVPIAQPQADSGPKFTPISTPTSQQKVMDGKMPNKTDVPRRFTKNPPAAAASATAAKTQKTISASQVITTNNANQTATANSTSTSMHEQQAKVVSHNEAGEDTTDGCLPLPRKDIQLQQPQGPKFRRGFAAVTKHHSKIGSNSPLSSTRNSPEDWPSLQITTTTVVTPVQDPLTQTNPVIMLPLISLEVEGKMPRVHSGDSAAATTPNSDIAEDISGQKERCQLPSDNWPSVVANHHHTIQSIGNKESSLESHPESGWHSGGSDLTTEDTPSEASSGELHAHNKDSLPGDENSRNHSENGSLASSDDQGVVDNELEADASSGGSKKGKKSKQKWVKLDLPEPPSAKTRHRQERQSMEKERNGGEKVEPIGANSKVENLALQNECKKSKIKLTSSKDDNEVIVDAKLSNGPTNDERSNVNYLPRGRGGRATNNGIRGRGGRGRFGTSQYWGYSRENSSPSEIIIATSPQGHGEEFCQDFPADYTTLPPLYPMTEFVMPYSTDPYYAARAPNYTPPQASVDEAQLVSGYVPVDATVLLEMVKKQIEYYFSEGNLEKDFYLRRKMNQEGFLPLSFIATFPRVKIMTQNPTVVIQAIQASSDLELTEDFIFVRTRNTPEKWPLTCDHSSQEGTMTSDPTDAPSRPTALPLNNATNTNGYDLLSDDDTFSKSNPILSPGTNLDPNVAEFVPKSYINISLTV